MRTVQKNLITAIILMTWQWLIIGNINAKNQTDTTSNDLKSKKVWVFVLAGQSNMAGRGKVEAIDTISTPRVLTINAQNEIIPAKEPIHFYDGNMKGTGCGLAFGKALLKHIPADITILLIPTAVGGSSINQWLNDAQHRSIHLLTNFSEKVALGKKYGDIKAILWHQGETDATPEGINHRQEKLKMLFRKFRNIVDNQSLPILIGELGSYSNHKKEWAQMNKQSELYARKDKNTSIIRTSDLKDRGDHLHFNSKSQRALGKRFANVYLQQFNH